jgi:hypothetical protein
MKKRVCGMSPYPCNMFLFRRKIMDEKKKFPLTDKLKEGVSVQELENLARKYTVEGFLIFSIIIATISSIFGFFTGYGWSLLFAGLGAISSIAFPEAMGKFIKKLFKLVTRQEKAAQIAIGIVRVVLALFIPFILFAEIGILAGSAFHHFSHSMAIAKTMTEKYPDDEEHI